MGTREKLYDVLKEYLAGNYTSATFADVMFEIFFPDVPREELSEDEFAEFGKLAEAASRFSKYDEDFINCPGAFVSSEELFSLAQEVHQFLAH